jgi:hypothetical protein
MIHFHLNANSGIRYWIRNGRKNYNMKLTLIIYDKKNVVSSRMIREEETIKFYI